MKVTHSCPAWVAGLRPAHPKFGGGVTIGGLDYVEERLFAIREEFPHDLTSLHLLHEMRTETTNYSALNNPHAIGWPKLVEGIREGRYPRVAALTAPAFGWPGVEHGAILSPDPKIRAIARDLHLETIEKAAFLKAEGLGEGIVIVWPAFDSHRVHRLPTPFSYEEGWERLVEFWCELLGGQSDAVIHWEWKPCVPGERDYVNSIGRAIKFCREINKAVGRQAMLINNEWAHLLISGTTVLYGTEETIEAGLFSGFFHANSAELAEMSIDDDGKITYGAAADDADWYVGAGDKDRWTDQVEAVETLVNWAKAQENRVLIAEHDIDPGGEDPIEYYRKSRENLNLMFAKAGYQPEEVVVQ